MASSDALTHPADGTPAVYTVANVVGRLDDARAFAFDSLVLKLLPFLPGEHLRTTTVCLPGWVVNNLRFLACDLPQLAATQRFLATAYILYLMLTDRAASWVFAQLGALRMFETTHLPHCLRAALVTARGAAATDGCPRLPSTATSESLPPANLADLRRVLGHTSCPEALADPTADVHLLVERLMAALTLFGGVPSPSDTLLSATETVGGVSLAQTCTTAFDETALTQEELHLNLDEIADVFNSFPETLLPKQNLLRRKTLDVISADTGICICLDAPGGTGKNKRSMPSSLGSSQNHLKLLVPPLQVASQPFF
eukprot:6188270-Pleurochrysis_carterae.AAC.1